MALIPSSELIVIDAPTKQLLSLMIVSPVNPTVFCLKLTLLSDTIISNIHNGFI